MLDLNTLDLNVDYYAILAVSPDVSVEQLRHAYRQAALGNHPDRQGGSNEKMKAVNFAYEVLSNPHYRTYYDDAREGSRDAAAQAEWADRTQDLRKRAAEYPKQWSEFEKWMDGFMNDVLAAKYGESRTGAFAAPTVTNSVSGTTFAVVGAVLSFVIAFCSDSYSAFLLAFPRPGPFRSFPDGLLLLIEAPLAGWCIGLLAHALLKSSLEANKTSQETSSSQASPPPEHKASEKPSVGAGGSSQQKSLPAPDIVQCSTCGKKLRVPHLGKEMSITCPACKNKFDYRPPSV